MSVTKDEMIRMQSEERMRRLKIISNERTKGLKWKEIAEKANITVDAAKTCWRRYKNLILNQDINANCDNSAQEDEKENKMDDVTNDDAKRNACTYAEKLKKMTPKEILKSPAFQTEFYFSKWKSRTPGEILVSAKKNGNIPKTLYDMNKMLKTIENNMDKYPQNPDLFLAINQAVAFFMQGKLENLSIEPCEQPENKVTQDDILKAPGETQSIADFVPKYCTHYLVDTENVNGTTMFMLLQALKDDDCLHLFYTDNSSNFPFGALEFILKRQKQIHLEHCSHGEKNALDFQILSALGFMIAYSKPEKQEFVILSKDHGYDPTVQFWLRKGIRVRRSELFCDCKKSAASKKNVAKAKPVNADRAVTSDKAIDYYNKYQNKRAKMESYMSSNIGNIFKQHNIKVKKPNKLIHIFFKNTYTASDFKSLCDEQTVNAIMKLDPQIIKAARQKAYELTVK